MIGDVLLLGEKHERATDEILAVLDGKISGRFVVAVGGESGTGKSEIAHLLRKAFVANGRMAKTIHTDNYYCTTPNERTQWRQQRGVKACVGLSEYRWDLISQHIEAFRNGADEVTLPFIDIVTGQIDRLTTCFADVEILVLEGLYAVAADADFKVLIDLTYHDTKDAQSLRGKEPQNQYRAEVLEAEHLAVQSLRDRVDLFISRETMGYS